MRPPACARAKPQPLLRLQPARSGSQARVRGAAPRPSAARSPRSSYALRRRARVDALVARHLVDPRRDRVVVRARARCASPTASSSSSSRTSRSAAGRHSSRQLRPCARAARRAASRPGAAVRELEPPLERRVDERRAAPRTSTRSRSASIERRAQRAARSRSSIALRSAADPVAQRVERLELADVLRELVVERRQLAALHGDDVHRERRRPCRRASPQPVVVREASRRSPCPRRRVSADEPRSKPADSSPAADLERRALRVPPSNGSPSMRPTKSIVTIVPVRDRRAGRLVDERRAAQAQRLELALDLVVARRSTSAAGPAGPRAREARSRASPRSARCSGTSLSGARRPRVDRGLGDRLDADLRRRAAWSVSATSRRSMSSAIAAPYSRSSTERGILPGPEALHARALREVAVGARRTRSARAPPAPRRTEPRDRALLARGRAQPRSDARAGLGHGVRPRGRGRVVPGTGFEPARLEDRGS